MTQILRPSTAFAQDPHMGKKRPRQHSKDHLDFIRGLPCVVTKTRPVEAAHIRYADLRKGKRSTGGQEKPDDKWTVPLSLEMHREQHSENEREWWKSKGIDPCEVALVLWSMTGDYEAAEAYIKFIVERRQ